VSALRITEKKKVKYVGFDFVKHQNGQ